MTLKSLVIGEKEGIHLEAVRKSGSVDEARREDAENSQGNIQEGHPRQSLASLLLTSWNAREKQGSGFKIQPARSQFPQLHGEGAGLDSPFQPRGCDLSREGRI